MAHIKEFEAARTDCSVNQKCENYYAILAQEDAKIDDYRINSNQTASSLAIVIAIICILLILTAYSKNVRKFQAYILPKLLIALPIISGLTVGAIIGFFVTFSACFSDPCSSAEYSAFFIIPLISLFSSIPITKRYYRGRDRTKQKIENSKKIVWILIGLTILILNSIWLSSTISQNNEYAESRIRAVRSHGL